MSKLIISIWEVCDPTELPKSLEMTMAMEALLKIRKAQITPRFLDFANEVLTFIANNLERFKDDLDFLREMSDLPTTLSKNETPVLDLLLPQKESSFFLNEIVKIASKYNIVMLIQGLDLAFLPDDVIYPTGGNEKWQTIINVPPPKKLKAFKKWAEPIITKLVKKYDFEPYTDFPTVYGGKTGFYYQRVTAIGVQLIIIDLFENYEYGVFYFDCMGVSFAQPVLDIYDKFDFSNRPTERGAFTYHDRDHERQDKIESQAEFYQKFIEKVENKLIKNVMNVAKTLGGIQKLSIKNGFFSATQLFIINYLCHTLSYEVEQQIFLNAPNFFGIAPKFLALHDYIQEQRIITKKEPK